MNLMERILYRLFDVEPPGPGQDLDWSLCLPQAWPGWVLLLVLVGAGAAFFWLYRREGTLASPRYKLGLTLLRWLLVLMVVLMLGELDLRVGRRGLPYLAVIVDKSQSMGIADHYGDQAAEAAAKALAKTAKLEKPTRLDLAKALLLGNDGHLLRRLARRHRLIIYTVASTQRRLGEFNGPADLRRASQLLQALQADGPDSRLGNGLRAVLNELSGTPPAAVVLFSDGITTDGEPLSDAAKYATRKNVPVYTVGIGDPLPIRDLELRDLIVDDVVFVDDVVNFEAKLSARGLAGGTATVRLRQKGRDQPLASQQIELPEKGRPVTVRLQYRPRQAGDLRFVIEVDPVPREFQTDNNRIERQISVREQKVRVLFVESYPRFQYRFLKHLLERDPTIELKVLLLEADVRHPEQDRSAISHFPTSRDELWAYDVVLFGDVNPLYLNQNQLRNLSQFVMEKGGGLALLAGPRYMPLAYGQTPLATVIPTDLAGARPGRLEPEPVRPLLTAEGQGHPIFRLGKDEAESIDIWNHLPGGYWFFEAPRAKPGTLTLAVHPTRRGEDGPMPVIVLQQAGAGKSLLLAFDFTWRWRDQVGDLYFSRFWVQTVRFLSRAQLIGQSVPAELSADRQLYRRGQPVQLRLRILDDSLVAPDQDTVVVQVERESGGQKRVTLRRPSATARVFEGVYKDAPAGSYRAWLLAPPVSGKPPGTKFEVRAPPGEFRRIEMDAAALKLAAQATGGAAYQLANARQLARAIPPGRKIPLDTDPPIPLWNTWPMLVLFILLLVAEWLLRKYKRML